MSFNKQGFKYKKISILNIIIYFINRNYKNIIRFINLLKLFEYKKTGINKYIKPYVHRF